MTRISPVGWEEMYQRLPQCGYRFADRVQLDVTTLLQNMPPGMTCHIAQIPNSPPLFLIKGNLFPSQGLTVPQIEYVVTLIQSYPNAYPVITIEQPLPGWCIKPHRNIDRQGICHLQSSANWNPRSNQILNCVQELQKGCADDHPFERGQQPPPARVQQQQQPQRTPAAAAISALPGGGALTGALPGGASTAVTAVRIATGVNPATMLLCGMIAGAVLSSSGRTDDAAARQREEDKRWMTQQRQVSSTTFIDPQVQANASICEAFKAMIAGAPLRQGCDMRAPIGFGFTRFVGAPNATLPLMMLDSIPRPLPVVTDPTPDQAHALLAQKKIEQQQAEEAAQQPAKATGAFGFASRVASLAAKTVGSAASSTASAVENKVRENEKQKGRERFTHAFPQYASQGEALAEDYPCSTLAGDGTERKGDLFITNKGVHFSNKPAAGSVDDASTLLFEYSVPLNAIVSIVKGECVNDEWIHLVSANSTFRSIFNIETGVAGKIGGYVSSSMQGTPTSRCYNWLDHMWRAALSGSGYQQQQQQQPAQYQAAAAPPPIAENLTCCICADQPKNAFLQPCGHVCCCMACAGKIKQCPLCRGNIDQIFMAFV